MGAHSNVVGGSNAARRLNCPRSLVLERRRPPEVDRLSAHALEGSALHALVGDALTGGLETDEVPARLLPYRYERDGQTFTVDRALWDAKGAPVLDALLDHLDWLDRTYGGGKLTFRSEQKLDLPDIAGAHGTADICGMAGTTPFVIDLKFGHNPVEAEGSAQLLFYAAAYLASLDTPLPATRRVEMAIIQPIQPGGATARLWAPAVADVAAFVARLASAIAEAQAAGDAARIAKGDWCRWAPCRAICPLHVSAVEKLASVARDLDAGDRYAETLALGLSLAADIRQWLDAIETEAHSYLSNGGTIPGYHLVAGRASPRRWALDDDAVADSLIRLGLDEDAIRPRRLLTPAQAERIVKQHGVGLPPDLVERPGPAGTKIAPIGQGDPVATTTDRINRLVELTGSAREREA